MTLFRDPAADPGRPPPLAPLAERMRPRTFDEFLGQEALHAGRGLRAAVEQGAAGSLILWGPPGVGKTTLAHLIARHAQLHFLPFSAVLAGVAQVREAIAGARERRTRDGTGTLLFVDEIHRFNRAQQDAFLPYVERGDVVLIGATTENPAFAINPALLSRCRVVPLQPLSAAAIGSIVAAALADAHRGLGARRLQIAPDALRQLVHHAGGDARRALVALEAAAARYIDGETIASEAIIEAFQHGVTGSARDVDLHYDLLSALHKSLRNSDVQASVYWLARCLESGADPTHAARRIVAVAAEDVGLADPMALQVATAAVQALQFLGLPEARLALAEAVIYLAAAPKSDAVQRAIDCAIAEARTGVQFAVPPQLRNPTSALARDLGHGQGYVRAHDTEGGVAKMACLPPELAGAVYYQPGRRGFEQRIAERMIECDRSRRDG